MVPGTKTGDNVNRSLAEGVNRKTQTRRLVQSYSHFLIDLSHNELRTESPEGLGALPHVLTAHNVSKRNRPLHSGRSCGAGVAPAVGGIMNSKSRSFARSRLLVYPVIATALAGLHLQLQSLNASAAPLFAGPAVTPTVSPVQARVDLGPAPGMGMQRRYLKHFPVDTFNGEVRWSETDLRVSSRGMDFVWKRTFTSRSSFDHGHGINWDFSYNKRIADQGGSPRVLAVMNGEGREDLYTETSAGSNTFHAIGLFDVIVDNGSGNYTQTLVDRTICEYSDSGQGDSRMVSCSDRHGNTCTMTRNAFGNITSINDTQDRDYTLTYTDATPSQRIATLTDFAGRTVVFGYESDGDLKTVSLRQRCVTTSKSGPPAGR